MATNDATDDPLARHLETALNAADEDRISYHLREALQIRISEME
jgi:hypothetical protein